MDNRIPDDFIEEVRQRSDIVEIISEHVVLKRTGKNYQGLCPFHSEKTPSFNVNPDRQMFYCFGCHTGGNVFSFLMKKENLTFMESLRILAQKAGMNFPEKQLSPRDKEKEIKRKRWQEIHELAAVFFQEALLHKAEGQTGLAYLRSRGLDNGTIEDFRLGFAPGKWDALIKEMNKKGVGAEELAEFGLVVRKDTDNKDKSSFYDRFRSRVIFTISDIRGNPIAFGGRTLDDTLPKYLNSPETKFFQKGRNLYGLHTAYRSIREKGYALLLEGYMDVIAVWKAGFTNAVASLGTALTKDQAGLLKKYTSKVIICYDSDEAGIQAALRAGEILLKQGLQVEVMVLEEAKDPDEFLREHTSEEFRQKLDKAVSFIEYKYYTLTKDKPPGSISEKAGIIRTMAPDILKIVSPAEREGYERYLSLQLGLTLEAVGFEINSVGKQIRENKGYQENFSLKQDISVKNRNTIKGIKLDYPLETFVPLGVYKAEQIILRIILEFPDLKERVLERLPQDFWSIPEHRIIFETHRDRITSNMDDQISYEQVQTRLAEIYSIDIDTDKAETLLRDCIQSICLQRNKETIEDLQSRMIRLENSGDTAGALALLQEIGERLKRGEQ